ncbi:MAG: hypothetical protein H0V66_10975 [Bdellovibrionales bacterium]|nr:hypothetical protein [Bdellovibrionales bacterium]
MKKKSLKGFLKSHHFSERQKERSVSDNAIIKTILAGDLSENEYGHNFILGHLKVTVDLKNSTLITVHPGDPSKKKVKILTKDEAKKISQLIMAHELQHHDQKELATDEFLQYVTDFSIKKIND